MTPVTPMTRWLVVVAHRDPQQGRGDELGRHGDPGTVVARAHVPTPADEGVALPVVLKDIGWRSERVVDGEVWHDGPLRRPGQIDADVHVHLRLGGRHGQAGDRETEAKHCVAHEGFLLCPP